MDENGNPIDHGNLISLTKDGKLRRNNNVNTTLGFELDDKGRIKAEDE
ncbi:hypothetical protein GQ472_00675 [archaeon]|nr:hypothetical protein [archaeon]